MVHFNVVRAVSDISVQAPEADGWKDAAKFNCKGRVVSDVDSKTYRIIAKKERTLSWMEYFGRLCRGFFWISCTLGCALSDKSVRQLFTKGKTSLRFAVVNVPPSLPAPKPKVKKSKKSHSHSSKSYKSKKSKKSSKGKRPPSSVPSFTQPPLPSPIKLPPPAKLNLPPQPVPIKLPPPHVALPPPPAKLNLPPPTAPIKLPPAVPTSPNRDWKKLDMFSYELKEAQKELKSGVVITPGMCQKITVSLPRILTKTAGDGVIFYESRPEYRVFSLAEAPDLVFKMRLEGAVQVDSMKQRFEKMAYAKAVTMRFFQRLLVIPSARLFKIDVQGKTYEMLAEEKLNFDSHISKQEEYYEKMGQRLLPAVSQLANFISQTGYCGTPANDNPIIDDPNLVVKIGFFNFDFEKRPEAGIRSLLRTVSVKNAAAIVNSSAALFSVKQDPLSKIMEERKKEYEEHRRLDRFHSQRKIRKADELLQIDPKHLDFSAHPLDPQRQLPAKTVGILHRFSLYVINHVNQQIVKSSPEGSRRWRRKVVIDLSAKPFDDASTSLVDPTLVAKLLSPEARFNATYLGYVVKKLVDLGLLFKSEMPSGNQLNLQA
jgi:hypothetical protein